MLNQVINFFLPTAHNNYRPWLIHNRGLAVLTFLVFIVQITLKNTYQSQRILGDSVTLSESEIIQLINQERQKLNLSPLVSNEKLTIAAQSKLKDMFEFNYWDHYSPSQRAPWQFIINSGYSYKLAGENLGRDYHSSQALVQAWMNSEGHRANLLKPEFSNIGVAIGTGKIDDKDAVIVVQFFATPAPSGSIVVSQSDSGEAFAVAGAVVNREMGKPTFFNIPLTSKTITLFTITLLIIVLTIDAVIMTRVHKIRRISGQYWSHMVFLYTLGVVSYWIGWKN